MNSIFTTRKTMNLFGILSLSSLILGSLSYPIKAQLAPPAYNAPYDTSIDGNFPVTDGPVKAIARDYVSNTLYVGGDFNNIGKNTGSGALLSDSNATTLINSSNGAFRGKVTRAMAETTGGMFVAGDFTRVGEDTYEKLVLLSNAGVPQPTFRPNPNGEVRSMITSNTNIFIAGAFTQINTNSVTYIAQYDNGLNFQAAWTPFFDAPINMLAADGTSIYAVGNFQNAGSTGIKYFAKIDPATAAVTAIDVNADGEIKTIMIDGLTAYVTGNFTNIGGQPRAGIAQIDLATGSSTSWSPSVTGTINAVAQNGANVYVAGNLSSGGKQNVVAISKADGSINSSFTANTNGEVESISVNGSNLYIGGNFTTLNGTAAEFVARVNSSTGNIDNSYLPKVSKKVTLVYSEGTQVMVGSDSESIFNSKKQRSLFAINLADRSIRSWDPALDGTVEALHVADNKLYVGGNIAKVGSVVRNNLAVFQIPDMTLTSIDPNPNNVINRFSSDGDSVYVAGNFTSFGGVAHSYLAALSKETGSTTSWTPIVNGKVNDMFTASSSVYIFGEFTTANGISAGRTAIIPGVNSISTTTEEIVNVDGPVYAATIDHTLTYPDVIYFGGSFANVGGQAHANAAAYDLVSRSVVPTLIDTNGPVYAATIMDQETYPIVYLSGMFSQYNGGMVLDSVAFNSRNQGTVPWAASVSDNFPGHKVYAVQNDLDLMAIGGVFSSLSGYSAYYFGAFASGARTPTTPTDPVSDATTSGVQTNTKFTINTYSSDADGDPFGMALYRLSNQGLTGCQAGNGIVYEGFRKFHRQSATTTFTFYIPNNVSGTYEYCAMNSDGANNSAWVSLGQVSYVYTPPVIPPSNSTTTSTSTNSNSSSASGSYVSGSKPIITGIGTTTASTSDAYGSKYFFKRNLMYGMTGEDVFMLQRYLNKTGFLLGLEGYGSYGLETYFFGRKTWDAVRRIQEAHPAEILEPLNLIKGTGIFHIYTRKFVNSN